MEEKYLHLIDGRYRKYDSSSGAADLALLKLNCSSRVNILSANLDHGFMARITVMLVDYMTGCMRLSVQ